LLVKLSDLVVICAEALFKLIVGLFDVPSLLDDRLTDYAHGDELLDSILDGFKHACLVELYLPLAVEGLKEPLDLVIETILIMWLVSIVLA